MDCLAYLIDRQIGHVGRKAAAALHCLRLSFSERLAIDLAAFGGLRDVLPAAVTGVARTTVAAIVNVGEALIRVVIWPITVIEPEIRPGRKNAGENEIGAKGPERIVIVVRPEREGEDVANEERPEYWPGPSSPPRTPVVPSRPPEVAAPAVPSLSITECVSVESGTIENVQALETLSSKSALTPGRKSVGAAELIVGSEPATTSPIVTCTQPCNIAVASNAVTGNMTQTTSTGPRGPTRLRPPTLSPPKA